MLSLNLTPSDQEPYEVQFRPLTYKNRRVILTQFRENQGYSFNELAAAVGLFSANGVEIPESVQGVDRLDYIDGSNHRLIQFYISVFMQMFTINDDELNRSVEEAKRLMGKPVESATTVPVTKATKS